MDSSYRVTCPNLGVHVSTYFNMLSYQLVECFFVPLLTLN